MTEEQRAEAMRLLARAERLLPSVVWARAHESESNAPADLATRLYTGEAHTDEGDTVHYVVATFSIEGQGFPTGSRGCDATIRIGATIVYATRVYAAAYAAAAEKGDRHGL